MSKYLLGPYLKKKRLELDLTRKFVAGKVGCTAQFILSFEHGHCNPPAAMLKSLINIYKLDPNTVLELLLKESLAQWSKILPAQTISKFTKRIKAKA